MFVKSLLLAAASGAALAAVAPPAPTITAAPELAKRQNGQPEPLYSYSFAYDQIPYKVNPYAVGRGPQSGYNICNSTTEGPDSQCQTAIVNNASSFCLWGAPGTTPNETIGDVEAAVVAYCSHAGYGTRIFPAGTITALQFMKTPGYIQVVGLLNQTGIGLAENDTGGELDPHGADQLGNPLGGLVFTDWGMGTGNLTQARQWNNFVGSGTFCFKVCYDNATEYCQNKFDLIGCSYNMPAAYAPNVFEACEGDVQSVVGTYTSDGQTLTWSQPESLAPGTTLPWTPYVPPSSNCVTYQSSQLFPISALGYQSTTALVASATAGLSTAASSRSSGTSQPKQTGSNGSSGGSSSSSSGSSSTGNGAAIVTAGSALVGLAVLAGLAL